MDNQNLNSTYLNSVAIANYMQMADQDDNNMLSVDEFAEFLNATIYTWINPANSPTPATGQQLRHLLPYANHNNLAHFEVYFAIGYFFLSQHNRSVANYSNLVDHFNETYGVSENPGTQPVAINNASPANPCARPNPNAPYRPYPQQPQRYSDCRNCDDEDIISREPIQDIPLNELFMLPSGNCMKGEDIQEIINQPQPQRRVDPFTRQALTGGKKRRSRKAKKTKKSKKTKRSKKSRKAIKSRKAKKSKKSRKYRK